MGGQTTTKRNFPKHPASESVLSAMTTIISFLRPRTHSCKRKSGTRKIAYIAETKDPSVSTWDLLVESKDAQGLKLPRRWNVGGYGSHRYAINSSCLFSFLLWVTWSTTPNKALPLLHYMRSPAPRCRPSMKFNLSNQLWMMDSISLSK